MKFNLLKTFFLIYFLCSIYIETKSNSHTHIKHKKSHQNKKNPNTIFSLFSKLNSINENNENNNNNNKNENNNDIDSDFDNSEISFLEKKMKKRENRNQEESESNSKENSNQMESEKLAMGTLSKTPVNYVVTITDSTVLSDWLTVESEFFKYNNKFPSVKTNPGHAHIKLKDYARVNERFKKSRLEGAKSELFFWFKFKKGYFYYFATKDSMNVLDAILIKSIEDNYVPGDGHSKLPTCFDIYDFDNNKFTICASSMDLKLKYLCTIQNYLKSMLDDRCLPDSSDKPKIEVKKEHKNVIIIPMASKDCNEKWNYVNHGADWECTCKEGISQSPINLPKKQDATPTSLAPMFTYERVDVKPAQGTIDGFIEGSKNIKIRYEKNAIRIFHPNMGKVVNIDGSVYIAEEIVFHTPSEHTIDGKAYDMEMQVIHYGRSKGDIANQVVLSILFKSSPGKYNKFLDKIDFFNLPSPKEPSLDLVHDFFIPSVFIESDADDVIGMEPFSFYTYEGSLTFPPCTERTTYFISADPVPLSNTVIQLFKEALNKPDTMGMEDGDVVSVSIDDSDNDNNRELKPTNGRNVYLFDHILNGCLTFKPPKNNIKRAGHYEKVLRTADEFIAVSGRKPSGIPGSFLVSEQEALGKKLKQTIE